MLKLEPLIAAKAKEQQGRRTDIAPTLAQCPVNTRDELAHAAGISHGTMHKVKVLDAKAT